MAASKLKVQVNLADLVNLVDGIPSIGFYKLESELYFLKENITNDEDAKQLEEATSECIDKARQAGNTHLQLLLTWHQVENKYCALQMYSSSADVREDLLKHLENLESSFKCVTDKSKYPRHVTLCRLFSYVASGYVNLHDFKKAKELLDECESHIAPAGSVLDANLDTAHAAYFYYARGRYYSYFAESTVDEALRAELKVRAIENLELSKQVYTTQSNERYHKCEVAMCYLQMTRVYLDVGKQAIQQTLSPQDVCKSNRCFIEGMKFYDEYEKQSGRRAVRVDARIDWWQSLLYFRMYQTYTPTENESFKDILLERAEFYCSKSREKLEKSGYSDRFLMRYLFKKITKTLDRAPALADSRMDQTLSG